MRKVWLRKTNEKPGSRSVYYPDICDKLSPDVPRFTDDTLPKHGKFEWILVYTDFQVLGLPGQQEDCTKPPSPRCGRSSLTLCCDADYKPHSCLALRLLV